MRFHTRQILAVVAGACIFAGIVRAFLLNPTPPAFQVTIYLIMLVLSPLIAYWGADYCEGGAKAFFVGGSIVGFVPWFLAFFWTLDALPRAFSQAGLEVAPIETPNVAAPTLLALIAVPLMLGSPWLAFLAGGLVTMLLYWLFRLARYVLVRFGMHPPTLSPRYLSELE